MAKKDETIGTAQAPGLQGAQIGGDAAVQAQAQQRDFGDTQALCGSQIQAGAAYSALGNADFAARSARELALGSAMGLKPENAVAALRAAKKFETYLLTGTVEE